MIELDFIVDMVEEQLTKGNLRWLANFNEIRRDYQIGDVVFPIYASGSLQERGFFLSKIFSALVTPKYKIHFFLQTAPQFDNKLVRKLVLSCKNKFGADDWIFLSLVQAQPMENAMKEVIINTADRTVGIVGYSLASKETVTSNNVLGKGLAKQLKLTEAKFEAFDIPNYLKSFTLTLFLGVLLLIFLRLSGVQEAIQPLTILLLIVFSLIVGHRIYKTRYHTTISLTARGFRLQEGKKITEEKWSKYTDVSIHITSKHETCIRLHSKEQTLDLPLSRIGLSRKEAYNIIKGLIKRKITQ